MFCLVTRRRRVAESPWRSLPCGLRPPIPGLYKLGPADGHADDPAVDPAVDPADDPADDPAADPADDPAVVDPADDPAIVGNVN